MLSRDNKRPIKIRKSWVRNPTEQVVRNAEKNPRPDPRRLRDEALEEYEESDDRPSDTKSN